MINRTFLWAAGCASILACSSPEERSSQGSTSVTSVAASGTGASASSTSSSVGGGGGAAYPAISPPIPTAMNHGGPILRSPRIVTVVFDDDPLGDAIIAFDAGVTGTPWWSGVTSEYCMPGNPSQCVGPGAALGSSKLTGPAAPSYSDADVRALLQARVLDGSLPPPAADVVYAFYFPAGTSIVNGEGGVSCQSFHAYHEHASIAPTSTAPGADTAYLIVTRCADANSIDGMTLLGSHELIEAATDPYLDGYWVDDLAWAATHGGELADLCLYSGETFQGSWAVERGFSNARAALGADPCVPEDGDVDFNLAPPSGVSRITLAPGGTATLDLVGYSSAALGPWSVEAVNSGAGTPLTLSLDTALAENGAHAALTITLAPGASAPAPFMIRSTRGSREHFWPGVVIPTGH